MSQGLTALLGSLPVSQPYCPGFCGRSSDGARCCSSGSPTLVWLVALAWSLLSCSAWLKGSLVDFQMPPSGPLSQPDPNENSNSM